MARFYKNADSKYIYSVGKNKGENSIEISEDEYLSIVNACKNPPSVPDGSTAFLTKDLTWEVVFLSAEDERMTVFDALDSMLLGTLWTKDQVAKLRAVIETAAQSLDDNTALTAICLHPEWAADTAYSVGFKVQRGGKLWRVLQAHTSQAGWEPENAASLWEQINGTHAGTLDDPIPYSGNMILTSGLYYMQEYVIYKCTRDTVNPVYNPLAELVGIYVEIV